VQETVAILELEHKTLLVALLLLIPMPNT